MAGLGIVDPNTEPVVGVAGLVALPVRAFHQAVCLVVNECAGFFLPGLRHAVAALVVGVGIVLVLAVFPVDQLVIDHSLAIISRVNDIYMILLALY